MRLTDYLNLARQRWLVVVAVVVVACVAVLGLTFLDSPEYVARSRVRLSLPINETDPLVREVQADVNTEAELVRSNQVADAVAKEIGYLGRPDELLDRVNVNAVPNTAVIEITSRATDGLAAVELANVFAAKFVQVRQGTLDQALASQQEALANDQRELQARYAQLSAALAAAPPGSQQALNVQVEQAGVLSDLVQLQSRLDSIERLRSDTRNRYEIIRQAENASSVRSTSPARAGVFGILIGLPLALAAILLLDSLSNSVRGRDDVERLAGVEVLGVIPTDRGWTNETDARAVVAADALSSSADAYRTLAHNLGRVAAAKGAGTLLITSPGDGDGKSSVAVNIALASSDAARKTLLLEADLRHPRAHAFLGVSPEPGLTDVLAGRLAAADVVQAIAADLDFVGAGSVADRPDVLVGRADVGRLLEELAGGVGRADGGGRGRPLKARPASISPPLVIVDTSPILNAAEVSTLAAAADAVILVARVGVTSRHGVRAAAEQVRRAGGHLLGSVVVGTRSVSDPGWSAQGNAAGTPVDTAGGSAAHAT